MELKQALEKNVYFLISCRIVSNSNLIDEIAAKGKLSKIFQLDNPDTGLKIRIFSKYSDWISAVDQMSSQRYLLRYIVDIRYRTLRPIPFFLKLLNTQ